MEEEVIVTPEVTEEVAEVAAEEVVEAPEAPAAE
jgi:hypothetical protein